MTYRILLNKIVGYKIGKSQNNGTLNGNLGILTRQFSDVAEEFCPQEVEDELLYLRMKEAYEHVGEYLEQLVNQNKKLTPRSQISLLEHLFERDSLATSMSLLKANSQDPERDGWDRMTLDQYFESIKGQNGQDDKR